MLSSVLNKQAQSGSPGAQPQLDSYWTTAGAPSAMPSTGNVLPINSDETGNNCKFDIPSLAMSSSLFRTTIQHKIAAASRIRVCLHKSVQS